MIKNLFRLVLIPSDYYEIHYDQLFPWEVILHPTSFDGFDDFILGMMWKIE